MPIGGDGGYRRLALKGALKRASWHARSTAQQASIEIHSSRLHGRAMLRAQWNVSRAPNVYALAALKLDKQGGTSSSSWESPVKNLRPSLSLPGIFS